jgi:hypothetical protein
MRGRMPVVSYFTSASTPAAVSVELGFEPMAVFIYNETDGTNFCMKISGSADDKGLHVVDSGSTQTDVSFASSNSLTITSRGFQVAAGFQAGSTVYRYIVW